MIVNIPTSGSLDDVALRLYFSAWSSLINMMDDFELAYEVEFDPAEDDGWAEERLGYLEACQPELQSICAIIQQSNELALKAKVCKVSPFLLLLKSDPKFSKNRGDIDFSEFRTLDAVDLPSAVNSLCQTPLSDKFIQTYNLIRSLRNTIAHLGGSSKKFEPKELVGILAFQYPELWKDRLWLKDRVEFASQTRTSYFHDYKYSSPHMEVMHELPTTVAVLGKAEFKTLFGEAKSKRRYLCHHCIDAANTRYADLDLDACKTAHLDKDGKSIHCLMCNGTFPVVRKSCEAGGCKGDVISGDEGLYPEKCHTCGQDQGDAQDG
ncbi:hypothetical protein [Mesorhizobium delmotii]|uniref:Uncharacterized protein n=1 Tax=Mesorhizobium delmotii TaxID=1631247 RepID=A0A2P9ASA5_9HYPH|nr:hypothetical protein [Mesorhizobium delmotii]SJM34046.1 hypothetical protein BQ8482_380229 [Mesorhizobium delmotii]